MSIVRLHTRRVEKVWGRRNLWPGFDDPAPDQDPIGEIWFEDPRGGDPEILIKYLFTAEKLSIQVHPDDAMARQQGMARGKDEAWVILDALPESTIAIGTKQPLTPEKLRSAALDGSIEQLVDWHPARCGDVFYSPAGTIHAIGAGLTLIEVQQNSETTFRLYDYGRPRELHLDESVAAARPVPYVRPFQAQQISEGRTLHARGPAFVLERLQGKRDMELDSNGPVWVVPVGGHGTVDGEPIFAGGAWLVEGRATLSLKLAGDILLAYAGSHVIGGAAG